MKVTVFWVVAPCSFVEIDRRFRGAYCLHHTWRNIIEDSHIEKKNHWFSAVHLERRPKCAATFSVQMCFCALDNSSESVMIAVSPCSAFFFFISLAYVTVS
jgi:hypothetical protein